MGVVPYQIQHKQYVLTLKLRFREYFARQMPNKSKILGLSITIRALIRKPSWYFTITGFECTVSGLVPRHLGPLKTRPKTNSDHK